MKNACPKGYTMSHQGVCIETKTDTPTRTNTINISGIGEIQLPTFNKANYHSSNPIMTTRENFQTSCWGTPDNPDYDDIAYSQAGWCYSYTSEGPPMNYYITAGNVFIEGVQLINNPLTHCGQTEGTWQVDCNQDWMSCLLPASWQAGGGVLANPCSYPNYCFDSLTGDGIPYTSGNCDAIALLYQGTIVGYDFVASSGFSSINQSILTMIPVGSTSILPGYPGIGDTIDDVLLYKASTGTHHRLTNESYNQYFNGIWESGEESFTGPPPVAGFMISLNFMDLHFGPPINQGTILPPRPPQIVSDCRTDEDCKSGLVCYAGKCVPPSFIRGY